MKNIKSFNKSNNDYSYHVNNNISLYESIFRPYSQRYFEFISNIRCMVDDNVINESVNNIDLKLYYEFLDYGKYGIYNDNIVPLDLPMINEAIYNGREVELNKPIRSSGPKKYKVYVKDPKTGNIKVVHFGDLKGGLTSKVNDVEARKNFAKRHDCKNKKDKTKPGYWSCNLPKFKNLVNTDFNGYW